MRLLLTLALLLTLGTPAAAAPSAADPLLADAKAVEAFLSGITTLKARFVQTNNDGTQVAGTFLLKRPGRMSFRYDPPVTDFIVADGRLIYYYDGQMKEQSSAPISHSLADFFLRKDLAFSGDIKVADVVRHDGLLQVTLVQTKDPLSGSLTLGLTENPMTLKKWRVVDAQGLVTEVELFETATGISLDNDQFHYYDPKRLQPKFN